MDLTNQQIKDTYGNVLTIGATAGSPQTGTLQNGEGLNITSATLTGGTVTTSNPLLDMTQTWNDAGVTFTSLKLNVTDTASGANSLLLDLQVGGTAKAQILKDGRVSSRKGYVYAKPQFFDGSISEGAGFQIGNASSCHIYGNNTATFSVEDGTNGIRIAGNLSLGFVNGHAIQGSSDVRLYRDAAYTLAQRVGTNAQTFNIYNTYTDGSNYERGFLKWDSNVLKIGAEALGTGTARAVEIVGTLLTTPTIATFIVRTRYINNQNNSLSMFEFAADLTGTGTYALGGTSPLLRFGGTTSSFPAFKASTTTMQARLADDTAFTNLQGKLTTDTAYTAGAPTATGYIVLYDSTGTAYKVPAEAV